MHPSSQNGMLECGSVRGSWPKGPICLQETKWSASEKEVLLQHIPGLQIAESLATPTPGGTLVRGCCCTCASWLCIKGLPQPWSKAERLLPSLLTEPANITLCPSISTLNRVRHDLAALCQALQGLACPDSRIILAGDFNRADERCAGAWDSFLEDLHVYDVFPSLGTFRHPRGLSPLDRCLVPNDWVSSARWNPSLSAIEPRGAQGHLILKMQVRLKTLCSK